MVVMRLPRSIRRKSLARLRKEIEAVEQQTLAAIVHALAGRADATGADWMRYWIRSRICRVRRCLLPFWRARYWTGGALSG